MTTTLTTTTTSTLNDHQYINNTNNKTPKVLKRASTNRSVSRTGDQSDMWKQIELRIKENLENFELTRKFCAYCGRSDNFENLSRCYGCQMVYYCSQEHQLSDWLEHMQKCAELEWVALGELIQSLPAPPPICDLGQYWSKSVLDIQTWTDWFDMRPNILKIARNTAKIFDNIKNLNKKREPTYEDIIDGLLAAVTDSMTYSLTIGNALVKIGINPCVKPVCIHCLHSTNDFDLKNVDLIKRQYYELCNMFPGCKGFEIVFIGTDIASNDINEPYMKMDQKHLPRNQLLYISAWHGTYANYIKYYCQIEGYSLPDLIVSFHPNFTSSPYKLINEWTDDLKIILCNNFSCLFTFYDADEKLKAQNTLNAFQTNILYSQLNQFSSLLMKQLINKPNHVYANNSYYTIIRGFIDTELDLRYNALQQQQQLSNGNCQSVSIQTIGINEPENHSLKHINGKIHIQAGCQKQDVFDDFDDDDDNIHSMHLVHSNMPSFPFINNNNNNSKTNGHYNINDTNTLCQQNDKITYRPLNFLKQQQHHHKQQQQQTFQMQQEVTEKEKFIILNDNNLKKYMNSGFATPSSETSGSYYQPKLNLQLSSNLQNTKNQNNNEEEEEDDDDDDDDDDEKHDTKIRLHHHHHPHHKKVSKSKSLQKLNSNCINNHKKYYDDDEEDERDEEDDGNDDCQKQQQVKNNNDDDEEIVKTYFNQNENESVKSKINGKLFYTLPSPKPRLHSSNSLSLKNISLSHTNEQNKIEFYDNIDANSENEVKKSFNEEHAIDNDCDEEDDGDYYACCNIDKPSIKPRKPKPKPRTRQQTSNNEYEHLSELSPEKPDDVIVTKKLVETKSTSTSPIHTSPIESLTVSSPVKKALNSIYKPLKTANFNVSSNSSSSHQSSHGLIKPKAITASTSTESNTQLNTSVENDNGCNGTASGFVHINTVAATVPVAAAPPPTTNGLVSQMKSIFEQQQQNQCKDQQLSVKVQQPSKSQIQSLTAKLASTGNSPLFKFNSKNKNQLESNHKEPSKISEKVASLASKLEEQFCDYANIETNVLNENNTFQTIESSNHNIHQDDSLKLGKVEFQHNQQQDMTTTTTTTQAVLSEFRILNIKQYERQSQRSITPSGKSCQSLALSSTTNNNKVFIKHLPDPVDVVNIAYEGERRVIVPGYLTSADILRNTLIATTTMSMNNQDNMNNGENCVSLKEKLRQQQLQEHQEAERDEYLKQKNQNKLDNMSVKSLPIQKSVLQPTAVNLDIEIPPVLRPQLPPPSSQLPQPSVSLPSSEYQPKLTTEPNTSLNKSTLDFNSNSLFQKVNKIKDEQKTIAFNAAQIQHHALAPPPPPPPPPPPVLLPSLQKSKIEVLPDKVPLKKQILSEDLKPSNSITISSKAPSMKYNEIDLSNNKFDRNEFFLDNLSKSRSKSMCGILKLDDNTSEMKKLINFDLIDDNYESTPPAPASSLKTQVNVDIRSHNEKLTAGYSTIYKQSNDLIKAEDLLPKLEIQFQQSDTVSTSDYYDCDALNTNRSATAQSISQMSPSKLYSPTRQPPPPPRAAPPPLPQTLPPSIKSPLKPPLKKPEQHDMHSDETHYAVSHLNENEVNYSSSTSTIRPQLVRKESVIGSFDPNDFDSFDEAETLNSSKSTSRAPSQLIQQPQLSKSSSPIKLIEVLTTFKSPTSTNMSPQQIEQSTIPAQSSFQEHHLGHFDPNDFDSFDEDETLNQQNHQFDAQKQRKHQRKQKQQLQLESCDDDVVLNANHDEYNLNYYNNNNNNKINSAFSSSNQKSTTNNGNNVNFFRNALNRLSSNGKGNKRSRSVPPSKLLNEAQNEEQIDQNEQKPVLNPVLNGLNIKTLQLMNKMQVEYEEKQKRRKLKLQRQQQQKQEHEQGQQHHQKANNEEQTNKTPKSDRKFLNNFMSSLFSNTKAGNNENSSSSYEQPNGVELQKNEARRLSLKKLKAKDKAKKHTSDGKGDDYQSDSDLQNGKQLQQLSKSSQSLNIYRNNNKDAESANEQVIGHVEDGIDSGTLPSSSYIRSASFDVSSITTPTRVSTLTNNKPSDNDKLNLMKQIKAELDEEIKSRYAVENANNKFNANMSTVASSLVTSSTPSKVIVTPRKQPQQQQVHRSRQSRHETTRQNDNDRNGSLISSSNESNSMRAANSANYSNSNRKIRSKSVTFLDEITTDEEILNSSNFDSQLNRNSIQLTNENGELRQRSIAKSPTPTTPGSSTTRRKPLLKTGDARLMCGALTGIGPIRSIMKKSATDLSITLNTPMPNSFENLPRIELNALDMSMSATNTPQQSPNKPYNTQRYTNNSTSKTNQTKKYQSDL